MSNLVLRLRPGEDRRLRAGHLWIYSNEIDGGTTPLKSIPAGSLCRWTDARGKPLGAGYVNPHTLLAGRILSGQFDAVFDTDWFVRRLRAALMLRERRYRQPFYRLLYGESDGVPGLVVDRYGDLLVAQFGTAGIEQLKGRIVDALQVALTPRGLVLRNDGGAREAEGLPRYVETLGEVPETVEIDESGSRFRVPLRDGQKTGWFFDQRDNRDRLVPFVAPEARVLDVFSYGGGWVLRAGAAGAAALTALDSSEPALALARANAAANGLRLETLHADALDGLRTLQAEGRHFDLVVVDPPALIKRKRDHAQGLSLYGRLNRAALHVLAPGGVLVSCSCSHHLAAEELQRTLLRESRAIQRRLSIVASLEQSADHPVHPAIPETRYLKGFVAIDRSE